MNWKKITQFRRNTLNKYGGPNIYFFHNPYSPLSICTWRRNCRLTIFSSPWDSFVYLLCFFNTNRHWISQKYTEIISVFYKKIRDFFSGKYCCFIKNRKTLVCFILIGNQMLKKWKYILVIYISIFLTFGLINLGLKFIITIILIIKIK